MTMNSSNNKIQFKLKAQLKLYLTKPQEEPPKNKAPKLPMKLSLTKNQAVAALSKESISSSPRKSVGMSVPNLK